MSDNNATAEAIVTGDIVYLKSGSPPMTVRFIHDANEIESGKAPVKVCGLVWFDDKLELQAAAAVPLGCLTKQAKAVSYYR